jgi:Reverse transcriptase (RNA-dependent DNA polymerase)
MNKIGFKWSAIDHSVFYWRTGDEHTIVAVATDDMAVTSKQKIDIEHFKFKVKEFWDVMDHGPIKWFLGFKIK